MSNEVVEFLTVGELKKLLERYDDDMPISLAIGDGKPMATVAEIEKEFIPVITFSVKKYD